MIRESMVLFVFLAGVAQAGVLDIEVLDTAGTPVPLAELRFTDEGDQIHRVHAQTGRWRASELYTPGGHPLELGRGAPYRVRIYAPGYDAQVLHIEMDARRKSQQVVLAVRTVADGASALELDARAAEESWISISEERLVAPSTHLHEASQRVRRDLTIAAAAWVRGAESEAERSRALSLCITAAVHPIQCAE